MRKLLIIAAASTLCAFPAHAQQMPESGSSISGSEQMHRHFGGMKGDLGERLGEHRTYGYERDSDMRRRGEREGEWRGYHAEGMREGCKYITVRERHGDEIVVRHFRRCD